MYNSPIEILITDIQHQIVKQQDEEIYQAVLNYVPNVDKEELLRALQYDRDQYEKGYADGKNDAVVHGRWIDNIDENGVLCNAWRKCSACGGLNYSKRPPYCPNCGAKMDEPPKGE
jgi:rubrerythrin